MTLPALLYYEKHPTHPTLYSVVVNNGHSPAELEAVIEEIRLSPEMDAARAEARDLARQAIAELAPLPGSQYRDALTHLAEYVTARSM
jgi:geranylgeranyl pyrophosphate synthase